MNRSWWLRVLGVRRNDRSAARRGFTLLEGLIAAALLAIILSVFWLSFGTGVRGFFRGTSHVTALQDTILLLDRIDHDLTTMVVPNSWLGAPVRISDDGSSLQLVVPVFEGDPAAHPLLEPVSTKVVEYALVPSSNQPGLFNPRRNDRVYANVDVKSWHFAVEGSGGGGSAGDAGDAGDAGNANDAGNAGNAGDGGDAGGGLDPGSMLFLRYRLELSGVFHHRDFSLTRRKELLTASLALRYGAAYPLVAGFVAEPQEGSWSAGRAPAAGGGDDR